MNEGAWTPLPWQQERWERVKQAVATGRLPHALLLAGPRGVGKRHFAEGLASFLLCESPPAARPCGTCRSCIQRAAGTHPNLLRLQPQDDRREIAIDDIRATLERLQLSSHYGQAKVVIAAADALNVSGVNALLKTVEEPPAATHLVFVSERWRALPATLRSRCQIVRFAAPPSDQALAFLRRQFPDRPEEVLRTRARAPQCVSDDGAEHARWHEALRELRLGKLESLKLAQGLKREGAQAALEQFIAAAASWMRALLLGDGGAGTVPKGVDADTLERLVRDGVDGLRALERNASPTLTVESIMIRWALAHPAAAR